MLLRQSVQKRKAHCSQDQREQNGSRCQEKQQLTLRKAVSVLKEQRNGQDPDHCHGSAYAGQADEQGSFETRLGIRRDFSIIVFINGEKVCPYKTDAEDYEPDGDDIREYQAQSHFRIFQNPAHGSRDAHSEQQEHDAIQNK